MNVEDKVISLLDRNKIEHRMRGNDIMIRCLNPAHEDSKPSQGIDKLTGQFYCFSCGHGGTLNRLLGLFGEKPDVNLLFSIKQELLIEAITKIRAGNVKMPDSEVAFRGVMGNCGEETLTKLGAFTCVEPELVDRICFPISNNGKLKFIEARAIDNDTQPRWKRWPEGIEVNFCMNTGLAKSLVLVEGWSDYANMYRLGCRNMSPLFGSQNFNSAKLNTLIDAGIQKIIVATDNDDAGWTAHSKILALCKGKMQVKRLVPETDPGDIQDFNELNGYAKAAGLTLEDGGVII